ncbi:ABC transporter permease [Consotaella salsifontis]|uniref:Monosaccharide ABC transporter membrane protein, CUT2 family n=1 Tax=Consotaella salsifontis TaxID=1365950 RepID=A0A1T4RLY4_9HYPH|nr:ABC transporter permease [Consotaella salsifontis]SKA16982.1 monosaccharide ABC transporter membrane protein, CUT2 family [Consotaella salsifontis]
MTSVADQLEKGKKGSMTERLYSLGVLLSLLLLCLIMSFLSNRFLTMDNLMNVAAQAAVSAIVSIGMFLAILTAGIDLSVGSILALSTMVMGVVGVNWGFGPYTSILACLATGAFLGLCNGLMLTQLRLPHPFISTLGMQKMARGIALVITAAAPISMFPEPVTYLGSASVGGIPVSFVLVAVLYIGMYLFLTRTTTGRYIYAVGGNKEASRLSGIRVNGILNLVYTISGFTAALAGLVLAGRVDAVYPLAGLDYETDAIAAVIIGGASFFGGVGSIGNTIIGVLLIAVLRNGLNLLNVDSAYQTFAIGAVIIVAVAVDVVRQKFMVAR